MISTWQEILKDAIKSFDTLYQELPDYYFHDHHNLIELTKNYPVFIPRPLLLKIKAQGKQSILAKQFLPSIEELVNQGDVDPIGDKKFHTAPQLIHRYDNRVLFMPTQVCPVQCRYCFRKNELHHDTDLFTKDFEQTLNYLKSHRQVNEVIFTGGDPLMLKNEHINTYLSAFSKIPHLKHIRFHTRFLTILPERFDDDFIVLAQNWSEHFTTLTLAIHVNHVDEFDDHSIRVLNNLINSKWQILTQSVLLKGINNTYDDLYNLFKFFMDHRVRPYYLHHPDQVKGGMHFYLSPEEGSILYKMLRKNLPGWAIPQYMIETPHGGGKIWAYQRPLSELNINPMSKHPLPQTTL